MGIKKFIETLKNFGDTISSTAENVFDEDDTDETDEKD